MTLSRRKFAHCLAVCLCAGTLSCLNSLDLELSLGRAEWTKSGEPASEEPRQSYDKTTQGSGLSLRSHHGVFLEAPMRELVFPCLSHPDPSQKSMDASTEPSPPAFFGEGLTSRKRPLEVSTGADDEPMMPFKSRKRSSEFFESSDLKPMPNQQEELRGRDAHAPPLSVFPHLTSASQDAPTSTSGISHELSQSHHNSLNIDQSQTVGAREKLQLNFPVPDRKRTNFDKLDLRVTDSQKTHLDVLAPQNSELQEGKTPKFISHTKTYEKVFVWIGSMPCDPDTSKYDHVIQEAQNRVLHQLKQDGEANRADTEANSDLSEREKELGANLKGLLHTVYCLNQRFLEMFFGSDSESRYEDEQQSLFHWIGNLNIPAEKRLHTEVLNASKIFQLKNRMECVSGSQENPVVLIIRERGIVTKSNLNVELMGKFAVHILGYYYKSTNIKKWNVFFSSDADFVKLLARVRRDLLTQRNSHHAPADRDFFQMYLRIPWQQHWDEEKFTFIRETNVFRRLFKEPIQSFVKILPSSSVCVEWAPGGDEWLKEAESLFCVSSTKENPLALENGNFRIIEDKRKKKVLDSQHVFDTSTFRQDQLRVFQEVDPKIYAWIGCVEDRVERNVDYLLKGIEDDLLSKTRLESSKSGTVILINLVVGSGPLLPALEIKDVSQKSLRLLQAQGKRYRDEIIAKILDLFTRLLSLNKLIMGNLGMMHTDQKYLPQQKEVCDWLLEKIFTIDVREGIREKEKEIQEDKLKCLIISFLENQENESVAQFNLRKSRKKVNIGMMKILKTQVAVFSLASYYMHCNPTKWHALFPHDVDFVKLLLILRHRKKNHGYISNHVFEKIFYEQVAPFPWKDIWAKDQNKYAKAYNPFVKLYEKTFESWLETLGKYSKRFDD